MQSPSQEINSVAYLFLDFLGYFKPLLTDDYIGLGVQFKYLERKKQKQEINEIIMT